jgi:hypothetical protein
MRCSRRASGDESDVMVWFLSEVRCQYLCGLMVPVLSDPGGHSEMASAKEKYVTSYVIIYL